MFKKLDPKQIEKSVIFLQSRDGILDIFFGLTLGVAGINGIYTYMEWNIPWYIRFLILILLVPTLLAKYFITNPRIGYIKMRLVKGGRRRILQVFLLISLVLTILMLAASIFKLQFIHGQMLSIPPVILFGAILLLMSFVAWLVGLYSLYVVGLAAGIGFFLDEPLGLDTILNLPGDLFIFCIPGALITIYGAIRLFRFLKTHPLQNVKADFNHE
jgi:hypothetical protein